MRVDAVSKCLICACDFVLGCVLIINLRYNDYMDANIEYAMLYLELNVFSLILIWIILRKTQGLSKMEAQRNFVMSIISEMIFFISDTWFLVVFTNVIPGDGWILIACKTVYFFSTSSMCFFWFLYFEHVRETNFVKDIWKIRFSSILMVIMGVLLIGNLFFKYLFYLGDDGTYHRGPLFILNYVFSYAYVLLAWIRIIINIIKKDTKKSRKQLMHLAFLPVAPGVAGVIQFIYPRLPVACVAMSLATLILYLVWVDELISLDPLTGLNNRKQLNLSFEQIKRGKSDHEKIYLLLVDANHFKNINDTYGHLQGDNALKLIARALREGCKVSGRRTIIARYGGDEFVILVSSEGGTSNEELKNAINTRLAELVEDEKIPFELTVSIGVATLEEDDSLKELIVRADEAMYDEKREHGGR